MLFQIILFLTLFFYSPISFGVLYNNKLDLSFKSSFIKKFNIFNFYCLFITVVEYLIKFFYYDLYYFQNFYQIDFIFFNLTFALNGISLFLYFYVSIVIIIAVDENKKHLTDRQLFFFYFMQVICFIVFSNPAVDRQLFFLLDIFFWNKNGIR